MQLRDQFKTFLQVTFFTFPLFHICSLVNYLTDIPVYLFSWCVNPPRWHCQLNILVTKASPQYPGLYKGEKRINSQEWWSRSLSQWEMSTKKDDTCTIISCIACLGVSFLVIKPSEDRLQDPEYTWDHWAPGATVAASRPSDLQDEQRKKYSLADASALSFFGQGMWL